MACQTLACPRCHLVMPRAPIHTEPMILSIIGVPASGKSYLLAAMTWQLRREMPKRFALAFNDADTLANRSLNDYEETLFLQHDDDKLVAIRKTEEQGELYDQIRLGQQVVSLPRPFLFTLRPSLGHPAAPTANRANKAEQPDRVLCMYDNAGESFQAGKDTTGSPVTQHVAKSRVLMFLFDPTQDPRFRQRCRAISGDPQLSTASRTSRQETILTEAALHVRRHAGLAPGQKYDRPLLVVVPKSDVWGPLLDCDLTTEPFIDNAVPASAGSGMPALSAVDLGRIATVSAKLRPAAGWRARVRNGGRRVLPHRRLYPSQCLGPGPGSAGRDRDAWHPAARHQATLGDRAGGLRLHEMGHGFDRRSLGPSRLWPQSAARA